MAARPRQPRVDPLVPTGAIDRRLGRTHVGTPDADVHQMLREAVDQASSGKQGEQWTPAIQRQSIAYGLWRHRQNRQDYVSVMGRDPGGHDPSVGRQRRWTDPGGDAASWSPEAGEEEMDKWQSVFHDRRGEGRRERPT